MAHDPQPRSMTGAIVAFLGALVFLALFSLGRPDDAPLTLVVEVQPPDAVVRVLHPGIAWSGPDEGTARSGEVRFSSVPRGSGVRVVVSAPGYQQESQTVMLSREGAVQRVMLALQRDAATLSIKSVPPGATLVLDGKPIGKAPLLVSSMLPGEHQLRAILAGHVDAEQSFLVKPGEQRDLVMTLSPDPLSPKDVGAAPLSMPLQEPAEGRARLRLRSTHTARFLVGDFVVATGLDAQADVLPGQHRVGANAVGRGFQWQLVTVVEGEKRDIEFSFPEDPLTRAQAAADPNEALHWIVKGGSARGEGGYGEAVGHFRKALELDPDNVSAHRELARTLPGTEDWQGALRHAERYLELDPAAPDADFTREIIAELKRRIAGLPPSWEER